MMLPGHLAVAIGAGLALGWPAFVGALVPDLTWVANEWRIQRGFAQRVTAQETIDNLPEAAIVPYRIAHSAWLWLVVALVSTPLAIGAALHVACDLPTHRGRMAQQPLYPLRWRWPVRWTVR